MLSKQAQDTIEKALYYARANVENYWHHWAGDKDEADTLEKIDAALAELRAAAQPQKPVPGDVAETIRLILRFARFDPNGEKGHVIERIDKALAWLDSSTKQVQP